MNLQIRTSLKTIRLDRNALRITAIYLLIGGLWILLSDKALAALTTNIQIEVTLSIYKGWFYVLVTGLLLYWLIRRNNSNLHKENEELQAAEKNYRDIFDNATVGIFRSTPDGRYINVNMAMAKIYGHDSPEQMLAEIQNISEQIYANPEDRRRFLEPLAEDGEVIDFIAENLCKDGTKIWTSTNARAVKDDTGRLIYYEGFIEDVTKRKQAEEELQSNISLLNATLDASADGILVVDEEGKITTFNQKFVELWRIPQSVLDAHSDEQALAFVLDQLKDADGFIAQVQKLYASPDAESFDVLEFKDGRVFERYSKPQYLNSESVGRVWSFRDVTERRQAEAKLRESEERFRSLYENSTIGLYRTTPEGKILLANPALVQMLGYSSFEELARRNLEEDGYEAGYERNEFQTQIERDGEVRGLEANWKRKDGTSLFVRESAKVIRDSGGKVLYYEGTVEDITERKRVEQRLRENEEKYRSLFEYAPIGILLADTRGEIIEVNPAALQILGSPSAEATKSINILTFQPLIEAGITADFQKTLATGQSARLEHPYTTKWDKSIYMQMLFTPIFDQSGHVQQIQIMVEDITDRKHAEEALRVSEERFRSFVEQSADGVVIFDEQGLVAEWNQAQVDITGIPRAQAMGMPAWEMQFQLLMPERRTASTHEHLKNSILETLQTGLSSVYGKITNIEIQSATGIRKPISQTSFPIKTENGYRVGSIVRDLTEQRKAEKTLFESESRYRSIFEGVQDAILVETTDFRILDVNQRACELYGYSREEFLTKTVLDLVPSEGYIHRFDGNSLEEAGIGTVESVNVRANGESFPVELSGRLSSFGDKRVLLIILRDITERKTAEENIRRRLAELETIHQSGLELSRILEPEQIAQRIMDQMERNLNWHHSAVRLYDEESQTLKVIGFNVPGIKTQTEREGLEGHFNHLVQKPGDGLSGWAVQHNQTLRIQDLRSDPRYTETFPGLNSGLYVPIKKDNRILGVISVENEAPDAFSESDEKLINTLANQAAIALENSRLQRETEQQLERLQALHSVDLAVTNSLDLNITLEVLINQVIQQLGADATAIFLLQSDVNSLKYISGKGFHTHLLENASQNMSLNESLAGRAIFEHHIVESQASQEPKNSLKEIWKTEGFRSIYLIPLLTKGEPKGVMEIFYRSEAKTPAKGWMDFLETLAGQAAIAIENIHLFNGLQRSNMELAIAYDATIEGWSRAMDLRDEETEGHTRRVTDMTLKLAADFDFSGEMLMHIRRGALLHDIGKLGVPDNILLKPDKLTDEEWVLMKKHPTFAFEMIAPIQYLSRAINIPYCHHEKWDGTGYPRGLSGEQIPLEARIFTIVDVWDALTSDRPYRKAWTKEKAMEHIQSLAGTHFDPTVVERFLELQKKESGNGASAQKVRKIVTSN